jgi:hypothetical protein
VITKDAADIAAVEATFSADFQNAAITPPTGDNLLGVHEFAPRKSRSSGY